MAIVPAAVCCAVLSGLHPPLWFQPTLVGMFWGSLFLIGFAVGSFCRGSLLPAAVAVPFIWALHTSAVQVTDLPHADCLLVTTILLSSGWSIARFDHAHQFSSNTQAHALAWQWSIGDLVFATAVAACFTQSLMFIAPSVLLFSVLLAMAGGLVCSWYAYRWAWLDNWSVASMVAAGAGLILTAAYVDHYAPVNASLLECMVWICMGPVNVIASQATVVLFALAIVRFEAQNPLVSRDLRTTAPGHIVGADRLPCKGDPLQRDEN